VANETLLLLGFQIALGILTSVGLNWTKNTRQEVRDLRQEIREAADGGIKSATRINGIEHDVEVLGSRLERVASVSSDTRLDLGNLTSRVNVCKNCPQPGSQHNERGRTPA
jgi:hypothetical protein